MKYLKYVLSTKVSLLLLITFATSMAVATFIENDHGTAVARGLIYEAWWFEIIMVWLAVNFLSHISVYKLFHKNRWPIGLFHLAFVIIILGAAITRYFSTEGTIHIREGRTENTFFTTQRFLQLRQLEMASTFALEKQITLISHNFSPTTVNAELGKSNFTITFEKYIKEAKQQFVSGNETYVDLAIALGGVREDVLLRVGDTFTKEKLSVGTKKNSQSPIKIYKGDSGWVIRSDVHLQVLEMATQKMGVVHANSTQLLKLRSLYQWDGGAFTVKSINEGTDLAFVAEKDEKQAENLPDVVKIIVTDKEGAEVTDTYVEMVSFDPGWHQFAYNDKKYVLTYGPRPVTLPFSLHLAKFELERYPGSQSPSSYASNVKVVDGKNSFPFRIFMNNVLDYSGYRFYQSSYDSDEKGTILAVNQDRIGTYTTYLGYFLLALGMVVTLFVKGSRFHLLNKKLSSFRKKGGVASTATFTVFCVLFSFQSYSTPIIVPEEKAKEYGQLIVQDLDGRMKPLNTLANEILRKLNGRSSIDIPTDSGTVKLTSEQFLLAVQLDPVTFSHLAIIKIDKEKSLDAFKSLGKKPQDKLSFRDFLNDKGEYLLHSLVEEANLLKPSERNEAHKALLKIDERFNIFYALIAGDFLRIFPNRLDKNNTWFTSQQFEQGFAEDDAMFVKNITSLYLAGINKGVKENKWKDADEALRYMHLFQKKAGAKVYPSQDIIQAELLYNKLSLGNKLFGGFWLVGSFMLIIGITLLFQEAKPLKWAWNIGKILSWLGFIVFTIHLGIRWYIAKHPPWTDGFEMLVFVAWGVLLFGLIFSVQSRFTIPLSLLFSGTLLFVAFLDWLNPEITNLMPVLHSYWLKIHVAIIVSSYAPLALAAILALLSLMLMIFKPSIPKNNWWVSLQELNIVSEMSITIGLFLLTIGTFLGGVWANESWGRYWAWDPKETWALISVIVYAFVLHLRLIPKFKNVLIFNLASLWAFSSIIMTSFGVNYYLSGLHSYAAGDPVPVPVWVYWLVAILFIVSVFALLKYQKLSPEEKKALVV